MGCCDLKFPDGTGIEVKAASYIQAWEQERPSKVVFAGLRGRTWNPKTAYSETQTYNAEIYVFCLQIEKDSERWDALDLDQWRFYVLPHSIVQEKNRASIGITPLRALATELKASELKTAVLKILDEESEEEIERNG